MAYAQMPLTQHDVDERWCALIAPLRREQARRRLWQRAGAALLVAASLLAAAGGLGFVMHQVTLSLSDW